MTENIRRDVKKSLDGGWGWFVCLGSSLITVNYSRVTVIMLKSFIHAFNKSIL